MRKGTYRFIIWILLLVIILGMTPGKALDRPKIGLVLSGGGARGFAHVGILKMLDSLRVPIDYITGTSMGGILGAMYAVGYSGEELEDLAVNTDWVEIFTDKPPRSLQPYFQKIESGRYQAEFGFENLRPYIPTGLIVGQNLSILFSSMTYPHGRITNFDELPIPFRCVAIDLYSGNEVVLKKGSLAKAIRSTMAIPTIFSAVEWGDSLLIDGGLINNMPVDVIKDMGADIVIAVDVMGLQRNSGHLRTALEVFNQTMSILGMDRWRNNIQKADLVITPDLTGHTPGDFLNEQIMSILQSGEKAAKNHKEDILELKDMFSLTRYHSHHDLPDSLTNMRIRQFHISGIKSTTDLHMREHFTLHTGDTLDLEEMDKSIAELSQEHQVAQCNCEVIPVSEDEVNLHVRIREAQEPFIHRITIEGNKRLPFNFIYRMLSHDPGDRLDLSKLNRSVMEMYGLGYFRSVKYDLNADSLGQIILNLKVDEHPKRRLRVGVRYNEYHGLVLAAGLLTTNFPLAGMRIEQEAQFAGLTQYQFKGYYPSQTMALPIYPLARFFYRDIPTAIFNSAGYKVAEFHDRSVGGGAGLGLLWGKSFNAEVEYQNEVIKVKPIIAVPDSCLVPCNGENLHKLMVKIKFDNLDNILIPRNGAHVEVNFERSYQHLGSDLPFIKFSIMANYYRTFGKSHTARLYSFWGTGTESLPYYKYHNQSFPQNFIGMHYDQLIGQRMTILRADYRVEVKKNLFLTLAGNIAFDFHYNTAAYQYKSYNLRGFGLGITFFTPFGTIEAISGRGDNNFTGDRVLRNVTYISLGTKF